MLSFYAAAGRNCGHFLVLSTAFGEARIAILAFLFYLVAGLLLASLFVPSLYTSLTAACVRIGAASGLPFHPATNLVICEIPLVIVISALSNHISRRRYKLTTTLYSEIIDSLRILPLVVISVIALFGGLGVLVYGLFFIDKYAGATPGRAILIIVSITIAAGLLFVLGWIVRTLLRRTFRSRRMLSAGKFTPESWKAKIASSSPKDQAKLLARTDNRTLRLSVEEFVKLLRSVNPSIKHEPALSTYWTRCNRFEEIERLERLG